MGIDKETILEPLGDNIIVRQREANDKSDGGIIIPQKAKKKPKEGEVLAIGPGRILENGVHIEMQVKVGDYVIFSEQAGQPITVGDDELLLMRQEDVLSKVSGGKS